MAELLAANQITIAKVVNGSDGYSPTVTTGTSEDGSTTVTVTNKDGSTTTTLVDGTARTAATNAQTSIDTLEIGGRNYILASDEYLSGLSTKTKTASLSLEQLNKLKGKKITISIDVKLENAVASESTTYHRVGIEGNFIFEDGKTQYIGVWRQLATDGTAINENTRISKTITVFTDHGDITTWDANLSILIQGLGGGSAVVGRPKLEIGSKVTDWTPAPEDIDVEITNVQTTAKNAHDKIDNLEVGGRNYLATNRCETVTKYGIIFTPNGDGGILIGGTNNTPSGNGTGYVFPTGQYNNDSYYSLLAGTYILSISGSEHYANMLTDTTKFYYRLRRDSLYGTKIPYNWVGNAIIFTLTEDVEKVYIGFGFYAPAEIVDGVVYFKLEKGNKPTDWSPAPEDVDAGIAEAQTTANEARKKILSWCHENNQTLIDGAKIYTGSINAESINVESLTADTVFIDEMETNLTRFKAVGENEYYETEITGEGIDFKYGTSEETAKTIAGISGDELQIKKTSVLDEMKIGKWSWKVNPNNSHLTLRWNGGDDEQ